MEAPPHSSEGCRLGRDRDGAVPAARDDVPTMMARELNGPALPKRGCGARRCGLGGGDTSAPGGATGRRQRKVGCVYARAPVSSCGGGKGYRAYAATGEGLGWCEGEHRKQLGGDVVMSLRTVRGGLLNRNQRALSSSAVSCDMCGRVAPLDGALERVRDMIMCGRPFGPPRLARVVLVSLARRVTTFTCAGIRRVRALNYL